MTVKNIVIGQKISREKRQRAKELRHEMTDAEKILWQELRTKKLMGLHFRRQQIIDGFIVDFYCHQFSLMIEVDGDIHDFQEEYDSERESHLAGRGFRVLRFINREVLSELDLVLKKILDTCYPSNSPFPDREGGRGVRFGGPK